MGTWTSRRRASSIRGARLDRLRSAWTLFGPLLGWALLGGALGAITGARLVASNPTIQGPDRIVAIADLAIGAAVVAALFGLFITALACPLRPRTRARLRLRPFRRAVVACGASLSVVLLASALAGGAVAWLVAAVLMALIAAVVTARLNDPALLGNLLLTCLALGSWPFIGDIVGAAFATAPGYVPFEGDFQTRAGPVVLIGIDGADWARIDPLLKAGRLPAIEGLLSNGLRAPLASETPTWSPILWTTVATGARADRHGVLDFAETPVPGIPQGIQRLRKDPLTPPYSGLRSLCQLLYRSGLLHEQPISAGHRRVKALWNVLSDVGGRVAVVNWFATWPAEPVEGCLVSDRNPKRSSFLLERHHVEGEVPSTWRITYPPQLLAELAGLDTPEVLDDREAVLGLDLFDELTLEQRAVLGADASLLSVLRHIWESDGFAMTCAAHLLRTRHPDLTMVYASGVDNISHRCRQPGVVDRYYEYIDGLLAQVLEAAGADANVILISDHGFAYGSPSEPGGFAHDHAPDGVLILSGPAFDPAARLERKARLPDVAPTVLTLLGLPLSRELEGRAWVETLASGVDPAPPEVDSYGSYALDHPGLRGDGPDAADSQLMDKLRALGYVAE